MGKPIRQIATIGYPLDTDLHQDTNGDGVSLLMAYALVVQVGEHHSQDIPVVSFRSCKFPAQITLVLGTVGI